MAYSYNLYPGNGSTTQFPVAFGYIRREHVAATVAGSPVTFTWVNNSTIQMDATPANGATVRVYRTTPIDAPLTDFADGTTLVASDLDTNAKQSVYIQQELSDSIIEGSAGAIPNGDRGDIVTSVGGTVWTIENGAVTSAKILDGTILNADVNASAGITAGKLSFTQAGTGATARTIDSKLKDVVSVKDFGAVGDGTTDDTAAIQAAINAANAASKVVEFSGASSYAVTSLTLSSYSKINGNNCVLVQISGTTPLINHVDSVNTLQTTGRCIVENFVLFRTTIAANTVGLYSNSPSLLLNNVRFEGFETGLKLAYAQFGSFYSVKTYRCTVGLYLESILASGGGNSISFYDFQAVNCQVGVVVNKLGVFPHHSIYFRNPSLLSNEICAAACFGTTDIVFDGGANELNGGSISTTLSYNGLTIKRSSFYFTGTYASIINTSIQEPNVTPCIILESSSTLGISNTSGYGNTLGNAISCDSTSFVVPTGGTNILASNGISTNFPVLQGRPVSAQMYVTSPLTFETANIPNVHANPWYGTILDTNGTASSGFGRDSEYGSFSYAVYGAGGAGRIRIAIPVTSDGDSVIMSCLVKSSLDTTLDFRFFGNTSAVAQNVFAGRWYRVVWIAPGAVVSNSGLIISVNTTSTQLNVCKFQQYSGPSSDPTTATIANAILSGAYNPKIKAQRQFAEFTSAPSSGTWAVGDIVYHGSPAASGNIGWVCTTAGSPGTWKTFGAISA